MKHFLAVVLMCLFMSSVALSQGPEIIKRPVSPDALWSAYLQTNPLTEKLVEISIARHTMDPVYRIFAASEVFRRGDYNNTPSVLARMVRGAPEPYDRFAWELLKSKMNDGDGNNQEVRILLGELRYDITSCGNDRMCESRPLFYIQAGVQWLWDHEPNELDLLVILDCALYESDKTRAARRLLDHPTAWAVSQVFVEAPREEERRRAFALIRSGDVETDGYTLLYLMRSAQDPHHRKEIKRILASKVVILDEKALQKLSADQLRLMMEGRMYASAE